MTRNQVKNRMIYQKLKKWKSLNQNHRLIHYLAKRTKKKKIRNQNIGLKKSSNRRIERIIPNSIIIKNVKIDIYENLQNSNYRFNYKFIKNPFFTFVDCLIYLVPDPDSYYLALFNFCLFVRLGFLSSWSLFDCFKNLIFYTPNLKVLLPIVSN